MNSNGAKRPLVVALICAAYLAFRFWHLTDSCIWFDEIFGIHAAEHNLSGLFDFVAQDLIHPPLFYILLKLWIIAGGESLLWLRLFPVLFSALALLPFYFLCRELKLNFPALALALSLLAVNGSLIKYAQEVRMYSLLLCLSLFSMWLFARFFFAGKSLVFLTAVNILLIYAHYFGWLVVLSEVIAVVILRRAKLGQILIMPAVAATSFAPWAFAVLRAAQASGAGVSQNLGWAEKPNAQTVFQFIFDLIEPFYFQPTSIDANSIYIISIPLLLIFFPAFSLYCVVWKDETQNETFRFLSIFLLAPVGFAFLASWLLPFSVWGTRHLIIIFAPFAILTAIAFERVGNLYLKLFALGLVLWLTMTAFLFQAMRGASVSILCAAENLAGDLRQSGQEISARTKVFLFEDDAAYSFWFALRREGNQFQIVKVNGIEGLSEDAAYFLPRGFDGVQTTDENGLTGERFFIFFRDAEWNEQKPPLKNLIEKGYKIGAPQIYEAQGLKAFLVEASK